jgi:hypothetical protein
VERPTSPIIQATDIVDRSISCFRTGRAPQRYTPLGGHDGPEILRAEGGVLHIHPDHAGGCSRQSDPEPSRLDAYVAEYVGLLNASDVAGLSELLNLPGYPKDAQLRVNAMGGKAWTLQRLDKSELTVGVFDLYISVGSQTAGPQTWTEHVVWGSDGRWSMIPLEATVRARTTPASGPTP